MFSQCVLLASASGMQGHRMGASVLSSYADRMPVNFVTNRVQKLAF
jgi:hypothetical protein